MRKGNFSTATRLALIQKARGHGKADLVLKNAHFLDVFTGAFVHGDVAISDGIIIGVVDSYTGIKEIDAQGSYIVPGFIDAHVHIESSLLSPARFAEAVLPQGTTSVIWDPHEIANVKGVPGIQWALDASEGLALDVFVMVPSCVPATPPEMGLEHSGTVLMAADLQPFSEHPRVLGLAEMMNVPGVLYGDLEVMKKLSLFKRLDGHCPTLTGKDLNAYAVAGIHSCHESVTLAEAKEKLLKGIHVLVREGSCAKNAKDLLPILTPMSSATVGLCSDDRNPLDILSEGHIHAIINIGLKMGIAPECLYRAASYAPSKMYGLEDRGAIAPGYLADLVLVQPEGGKFKRGAKVIKVFKRGHEVDAKALVPKGKVEHEIFRKKNLNLVPVKSGDFAIACTGKARAKVRVIEVIPNQILTNERIFEVDVQNGSVQPALADDVLKISVLERHSGKQNKGLGFVRGFNLNAGAIATSITHDCHNVIAVGVSDEAIACAVNELIAIDGGIVVWHNQTRKESLRLPLGGLMTDMSPEEVEQRLRALKGLSKELGCRLDEPFLQLSFLALCVIPSLKITDVGLVDHATMALVSVLID